MKQFYTIAEVANIVNVSQVTIRRHVADGSIPAIRVGRQIRIHEDYIKNGSDNYNTNVMEVSE